MTVDQILLPATAIQPPPPLSWPAAGNDRDPFGPVRAAAKPLCQEEPPTGPSGWPRIFPGL
jgi:hypothetical protein